MFVRTGGCDCTMHARYRVLLGVEVHTPRRGDEGGAAARRLSPDLILMDLKMPGCNGFTAIETLKSDPATKEIPILVMTAQVMTEDQERCRELGVDGFVMKPVDLEKFSREVDRVLSK